MKKGKLLIISGFSGVGKGTVVKYILLHEGGGERHHRNPGKAHWPEPGGNGAGRCVWPAYEAADAYPALHR